LAGDLFRAGYPRETAVSLRSFAKRCGGARQVLLLSYSALESVGDFPAALEVATQLVDAAPESGQARYWRGIAFEQTGDLGHALNDYMNTLSLFRTLRDVDAEVFYKLSQVYEKLDRPCDAITPLDMYVSLDPSRRRTMQIGEIIKKYAVKGGCEARYANGVARVTFAPGQTVHMVAAQINGVTGNFIFDTGASFVSVTSQFATKAGIESEKANQVRMQTASGQITMEIGYAKSIRVGNAEASGVIAAVDRNTGDPFGPRVDGLLGMSFLSRFNVNLKPSEIELTAIQLK
jgi:aspartyl protease family protein